jgi:hypothetical protein
MIGNCHQKLYLGMLHPRNVIQHRLEIKIPIPKRDPQQSDPGGPKDIRDPSHGRKKGPLYMLADVPTKINRLYRNCPIISQ